MKITILKFTGMLFLLFMAGITHAAIVSVTGQIQQVSSLTTVNPNIQLQTEVQDLLLPQGGPGNPPALFIETLVVPGVTYTAPFQGTSGQIASTANTSVFVNSYLLHLWQGFGDTFVEGTITFDETVLGVDAFGAFIQNGDTYFGITPTYFDRTLNSPFQFGDNLTGTNNNYFRVSADLRTLEVGLFVGGGLIQQAVELRAITQSDAAPTVPVPAAVWLFGSGLLGIVGVARRKKAA